MWALFVAHGEVNASIDTAPPRADRVVCDGTAEAGDPLVGRQVEEEAKDAFLGGILQPDRSASRPLGLIRRSNGRIEVLASLVIKHDWISPDGAFELLQTIYISSSVNLADQWQRVITSASSNYSRQRDFSTSIT
jgi:hypothetical protein